jgi:hypothetical protein
LNPDHIKAQAREIVTETIEQAKEALRDATIGRAEQALDETMRTTRGVGITMLDTIKRNPVPAALIGIGVGWLLFNQRNGVDPDRRFDERGYRGVRASGLDPQGRLWMNEYDRYDVSGRTADGPGERSLTDRFQDAAGHVQGTAGQAADQAQELAGRMADNVQQTVGGLPDRAQDFATSAQDRIRRNLEDSPLIAGGIAIAAGMAVGLAIPETEREQELLGDTRDSLMEQVKESARGPMAEQLKDSARQIEQQVEQSIDKAGATVDSTIH